MQKKMCMSCWLCLDTSGQNGSLISQYSVPMHVSDHDLLVVRELRAMANDSKKALKIAPRTADEQLKWLHWPEFVTVGSCCQ